MAMLKDEATILKSLMIKLNDDTAMLVTYQYHSERDEYNKVDRSKTQYRWFARIFKIEDLANKIKWLYEDANRLSKFKWPDDPWPYYITAKYPENYVIARWLATKLKKIKSWEDGQKMLSGYTAKTKKHAGGYNFNAEYRIDGYKDANGQEVSLTDREALLARVGQNLMAPRISTQEKKEIIASRNKSFLNNINA